ncbi:hypothetical protein TURU_043183 [Turdus rufiventris]|nr:hypothetical protein TURU_043183 [Turdus rufiventris]
MNGEDENSCLKGQLNPGSWFEVKQSGRTWMEPEAAADGQNNTETITRISWEAKAPPAAAQLGDEDEDKEEDENERDKEEDKEEDDEDKDEDENNGSGCQHSLISPPKRVRKA